MNLFFRLQSGLLTAAVLLMLPGAYAACSRAAKRAEVLKVECERTATIRKAREIKQTRDAVDTDTVRRRAAPSSGNDCDIARPIWWDTTEDLDVTLDALVRQIVEHKETVTALCGE